MIALFKNELQRNHTSVASTSSSPLNSEELNVRQYNRVSVHNGLCELVD